MASSLSSARNSRWVALVVLCAGMLMIVLDQTVVNVALPSIQRDLGFSQSNLAWVVNAYLIAFSGLLLLAGRLGDLVGRKRVLVTGLIVFTVASLLCGVALTQEMLVAARFAQGVGGALSSALILGMIVEMFPEPRLRARAIGIFSFVAAAGGSIGLLAGGVLTETLNWHWVFFVNLPIGVAAAILASRLLASDRGIGLSQGADGLGALLVTGALMLSVYTIVGQAAVHGWTDSGTLTWGAVALLLLVMFTVRQATYVRPLLPLSIFRSRVVSSANAVQALMVAGLFGMFFLGSLYMQRVLVYSALQIGLAFLPVALVIGALSIDTSARLATRFGPRNVLLPGLALIPIGLLLFARVPLDANYPTDIFPPMLLLGIGAGLSFPSLTSLAMSNATNADAGLMSGLVNTSAQVGGALGLAVLATLASGQSERLVADGMPSAAALTGGYQLALLVAAALVLGAFALAATVLRNDGSSRVTPVRLEPAQAKDACAA